MDLNMLWFALLGVLLTGYAVLDGFDLGVGILHLAARTDRDRRILMNSIGPLWDGNEVWLVTFGGALFAAFPHVYATAFSGFYVAFMLLLFCLIFRAVSLEFRGKRDTPWWRGFFDVCFFGASAAATLLFGVAVGNAIQGLPVGADREFAVAFIDLLGPYPLLVGALAVAQFALHGSIFLHLKTEGDLQRRVHGWMWTSFGFFLVFYVITTIFTTATVPSAMTNFTRYPWAWGIVVLHVLAVANIPRTIHKGRPGWAFVSSCCSIAALVFLFGAAIYPNLIVSTLDPAFHLTIYNAASSGKTLGIMRLITLVGAPFVLAYTAIVYWLFRGKVRLGQFSY